MSSKWMREDVYCRWPQAALVKMSMSQQCVSANEACDPSRPCWRAAGSQRVAFSLDGSGRPFVDAGHKHEGH